MSETSAKQQQTILHNTIVLTVITLVAGLLLGLVHSITAEPIAIQQEKTKNETMQAVFSEASTFEVLTGWNETEELAGLLTEAGLTKTSVEEIYGAYNESGELLGYVVDTINKEGYGGEIEVMTGINTAGDSPVINAISFLTLSETAGMGMKAKDAEFLNQFIDLSGSSLIVYTKNGKTAENEIDVISGCTVTTSSVTKAVNAALTAVEYLERGE